MCYYRSVLDPVPGSTAYLVSVLWDHPRCDSAIVTAQVDHDDADTIDTALAALGFRIGEHEGPGLRAGERIVTRDAEPSCYDPHTGGWHTHRTDTPVDGSRPGGSAHPCTPGW